MFFFTTAIFGQNLSDSVKVKEWVEFAKKNYNKAAFLQESSQKAHEALLLARKIRYKKGEVQALLALEALASHQNKTEESLDYAEKAIFLSKDSPLKGEYAHAIYAKAYTSYLRGMHKEALELYQNSLKIRLEINDKSGAATCYNSIGNLYNTKGDYQNAIAYL